MLVTSSSPVIDDLPVSEADPVLSTLRVTQSAEFYGTITVRGEANFESKVTFKKPIALGGDSAGTATVKAGEKSVEIKFSESYESEPKVVANLNNDDENLFISYKIANKTKDGFKIILAGPAEQDLNFDWLAFAVSAEATSTADLPPTEPAVSSSTIPEASATTSTDVSAMDGTSSTEPVVATSSKDTPVDSLLTPSADPAPETLLPESSSIPEVVSIN